MRLVYSRKLRLQALMEPATARKVLRAQEAAALAHTQLLERTLALVRGALSLGKAWGGVGSRPSGDTCSA